MPFDFVILKPKDGLRVCDPATGKPLAAEGENKCLNVYWQRRLNDGDVEIVTDAAPAAPSKKKGE
jgi:hypothetical protein